MKRILCCGDSDAWGYDARDGVHLSAEDHCRFAELMAEKIRSIL